MAKRFYKTVVALMMLALAGVLFKGAYELKQSLPPGEIGAGLFISAAPAFFIVVCCLMCLGYIFGKLNE